jgi:pimeloyl-ACP methyl ester carboxylesterase
LTYAWHNCRCKRLTGTFPDGATYLIDVPENWNKTLVLYSHGYNSPGNPNPAPNVGDGLTGYYLYTNGFALAGSSYATNGWAVHEAFQDQIAVLDAFENLVGTPAHTIAWGHSLGGMITAGLLQKYPERFSAALPMCGVVGGGVGLWNELLDQAFAFNVLIAGKTLQLTGISNPATNLNNAEHYLGAAKVPQGRAQLVAAPADVQDGPTLRYLSPRSPTTLPRSHQFAWLAYANFVSCFITRRVGAAPVVVEYRGTTKQLKRPSSTQKCRLCMPPASIWTPTVQG